MLTGSSLDLRVSVASSSKKEPGLYRLTQRGDRGEIWRGATLACEFLFKNIIHHQDRVEEEPPAFSLKEATTLPTASHLWAHVYQALEQDRVPDSTSNIGFH